MANHPKLIKLPGSFFDAVERLLKTAPPPKTAKETAERKRGRKIIQQARMRAKKQQVADLREARANLKAVRARRKKAR